MRHIKSILEFIRTGSKNVPIPEIVEYRKKLGIILIGAPGVGKSTFIKNFIHTKNPIKTFSTDDVSLKFTKDPNIYYHKSSQLNVNYLKNFIKSGNSFIYDTTGVGNILSHTGLKSVEEIYNLSKENDYHVIFIHLLSTLETSLKQNISRDRKVDEDYLRYAYQKQHDNMYRIKGMNPDNYYVVINTNNKFRFSKFIGNNLVKITRKSSDSKARTTTTTSRSVGVMPLKSSTI